MHQNLILYGYPVYVNCGADNLLLNWMDLPTRMTGGSEEAVCGAKNSSTAPDRHNLNASDGAAMFEITT
jgi:hypothetical protein